MCIRRARISGCSFSSSSILAAAPSSSCRAVTELPFASPGSETLKTSTRNAETLLDASASRFALSASFFAAASARVAAASARLARMVWTLIARPKSASVAMARTTTAFFRRRRGASPIQSIRSAVSTADGRAAGARDLSLSIKAATSGSRPSAGRVFPAALPAIRTAAESSFLKGGFPVKSSWYRRPSE